MELLLYDISFVSDLLINVSIRGSGLGGCGWEGDLCWNEHFCERA